MRRVLVLCFWLCLLAVWAIPATADEIVVSGAEPQTIKLGGSVKINDVCTFTIKSAKEYDVFFNTESGDASQFIVISFDVINWKTEPLYLRTEMKARLDYDESFEFEPNYLWGNPEGTYHNSGDVIFANDNGWMYIYDLNDQGHILGNWDDGQGEYARPTIETYPNNHVGNVRYYDPVTDSFTYNPAEGGFNASYQDVSLSLYVNIDSSKTVFDPLVQRTMHYVFTVPNIVAKDEGLRVLSLSIGDNEYQLRF